MVNPLLLRKRPRPLVQVMLRCRVHVYAAHVAMVFCRHNEHGTVCTVMHAPPCNCSVITEEYT